MSIELYGYRYSVYSWIARLALHEKGLRYAWSEVNPFAVPLPDDYADKHPFGRVPALTHGTVHLYETAAITHYIDEAFEGPPLQPTTPLERARVRQITSVIDNYAYWPLVRQVFSHDVFRPSLGRAADPGEVRLGLEAAPRVLAAIESLMSGNHFAVGARLTLADIHLAPMLIYFSLSPDGAGLLASYPKVTHWLQAISQRSAVVDTRPALPARPAS